MSDLESGKQDSRNQGSPEEASKTVASAVEKSAVQRTPPATASTPAPLPHKVHSGIAWLALLLVVALAIGVAWLLSENQVRETALLRRISELETQSRQKQTSVDELGARWQQELRSGLDVVKTTMGEDKALVTQSLATLETQLAQQQKELSRFSASDRDSWLLAEAGHLLRLANQRLVMAGDPIAAQALLNSADSVLWELDDARLHTVRRALAADIAALRAVEKVDVEGIYLRLSALIEQADTLVIFQMPEPVAPTSTPEAADGWRSRLHQGYTAALSKLSDYIIIRRRDVPMQALMDPQWEGLVRLNLRMLLEQAQNALLAGNQALYVASLDRAKQWIEQFQESDEAKARAISAEIAELAALTIEIPQPDISQSQQALDEIVKQRLQTVEPLPLGDQSLQGGEPPAPAGDQGSPTAGQSPQSEGGE